MNLNYIKIIKLNSTIQLLNTHIFIIHINLSKSTKNTIFKVIINILNLYNISIFL